MTLRQALAGRRILIVGSSEGLGLGIAMECVAQGASVILSARRESVLTEAVRRTRSAAGSGQVVDGLTCDASQAPEVARLVVEATSALGGLDGVVNSAAIQGPIGLVEDLDWDEWRRAVEIDLFGPVLVCRAVLPLFRRQGRGKIVNVSGGGATTPRPRFTAYAAAKAGLVRFTETLARELEGSGVEVNALAPGALNTRMLQEVLSAGPERAGHSAIADARSHSDDGDATLRRAAALCAFLLSDRSDGISGRLISSVWDPWETLDARAGALAGTDVYTLRRVVPIDRGLDWDTK